jgi:hypothetical protein
MGDIAANLSPDQAEQSIYTWLRTNYALPDPISKIITAQSGHETNGWTSNVWFTYNNGFGYGYQGNGIYESFDFIQDSVDAVVGWLDRHVPGYENIQDPDTYAQALHDNGYYTDSEANYSAGISRWLNNNLQLVAGASVAVLVVAAVIIYILLKK